METKKAIGLGIAVFGVIICGNVVSNSLYSRTSIDIDWKKATIMSILGISASILAVKLLKK